MEREVIEVQGAGIEEEEGIMKNVRDEDSIVDMIPAYKSDSRRANALSMSCATNHTMRAADDKSVVTFAPFPPRPCGGSGKGGCRCHGRHR